MLQALTRPGYDLLEGPMRGLGVAPEKVQGLLRQAKALADSLAIAFETPSGVPDGEIFLNPTRRLSGRGNNSAAGIGTLVLEWTRLSDLTGDFKYANLSQTAEGYLLRPTGKAEAFPGLIGTWISTENGQFLDSSGSWGGLMDSFYEYLIKMYLYDPRRFSVYKDRWILAADSTMQHLASHPSSRQNMTFLAGYEGSKIKQNSGHCEW